MSKIYNILNSDVFMVTMLAFFLLSFVFLFFIIWDGSLIGEAGKKYLTRLAIWFIFTGILATLVELNIWSNLRFYGHYTKEMYKNVQIVSLLLVLFVLFIPVGLSMLYGLHKEKDSELVTIHLRRCAIEFNGTFNSVCYIKGKSLESNNHMFAFARRDRSLIKKFKENGVNSFKVICYKSSNRIIELVPEEV